MKIFRLFFFYILINVLHGKKGFGPGEQDWGYVTVRPGAHIFWWLFYTTANDTASFEEKPFLIWLQGGPGVSGTGYGNFEEFGPLDTDLELRNHTWVKNYNVLIIDNPVGTGFSYVDSYSAFVSNNQQITKDLMTFIHSFFNQHDKFQEIPTYIIAESYGGKMTVEFAYSWYKEQASGSIKSNFKGIGLIDSFISSNDMYRSMGPYLYNLGMIDDVYLEKISEAAEKFVNASSVNDWPNANSHGAEIHRLIDECTSGVDLYNVLKRVEPGHESWKNSQHTLIDVFNLKFSYSKKLERFMKLVKEELNLESDWGDQEVYVSQNLDLDSRIPVVDFVEKLLNETNIQVYVINGQLDLIINTRGVVDWIKNLNWVNKNDWRISPMKSLLVDNIIEGYSKTSGNLTFYSVLRSGHMVMSRTNRIVHVCLVRNSWDTKLKKSLILS
ncbi:hypothetical protein QAD02_006574 [Eretmocerus hayati]|uniref:Uncharacterized protein n=1 Tax=Eretmocerus hayati TaxID=131215 RepID=A0ACC2N1M5_9HYME|nr:hypothetical protein QAD02_006574 [Eretmocerus hayati]